MAKTVYRAAMFSMLLKRRSDYYAIGSNPVEGSLDGLSDRVVARRQQPAHDPKTGAVRATVEGYPLISDTQYN
jgi:hypothetical protein